MYSHDVDQYVSDEKLSIYFCTDVPDDSDESVLISDCQPLENTDSATLTSVPIDQTTEPFTAHQY